VKGWCHKVVDLSILEWGGIEEFGVPRTIEAKLFNQASLATEKLQSEAPLEDPCELEVSNHF
jgi:hypothetical protein